MDNNWISVQQKLPPQNIVVETRVFDGAGERNKEDLKRVGRLWFFPDSTMYVYYEPTHWRKK
jgi:hypothetical protein